ncbi:DUF58 domain-containing protein [Balneola sp. MJW-20]|uniref:DUF58 domain-containing protein n=1 Tax=Gracilimonas aurantiaca TaxID=3234185 RepID=UPI003467E3EC
MGYFYPTVGALANLTLIAFIILSVLDYLMLFSSNEPLSAERHTPNRLSNGDVNQIRVSFASHLPFRSKVEMIDEIPHQFQIRDFAISWEAGPGQQKEIHYDLRPTERGSYSFGNMNFYVTGRIGLIRRKVTIPASKEVPVYPSFIQMRKFEMYAISNRLTDIGIKKIRRVGHTMEFDQIKEYVRGDDVRSINWKATARANTLMVNQYQDERSQQVISVVDMGRVMKMPFEGLSLLDYAINTSLVISNIALIKDDKAGFVGFTNDKITMVKPQKKRTHIRAIQEALYKADTNFLESSYEKLMVTLKSKVRQRSLILLYTNFETLSSMKRQLPYLTQIARDHLLVTVFFENTEMDRLIRQPAGKLEDIYTKTIAEKFSFEKRQIVKSLNQRGIQTILTAPKELSVNAINKYLELKARGLI